MTSRRRTLTELMAHVAVLRAHQQQLTADAPAVTHTLQTPTGRKMESVAAPAVASVDALAVAATSLDRAPADTSGDSDVALPFLDLTPSAIARVPQRPIGGTDEEERAAARTALQYLSVQGVTITDPSGFVLYPLEGTTASDVADLPLIEPPSPDDAPDIVASHRPALVADVRDALVMLDLPGEGQHRTLASLLAHMQKVEATDLHLQVGERPAFRIQGQLRRIDHQPFAAEHITTFLWGVAKEDDIKRLEQLSRQRDEQNHALDSDIIAELDVVYQHGGSRYRVNIALEERGMALVLRRLPSDPPALQDLRMPRGVDAALNAPSGLILIGGPTSSGKTTTLAAFVNKLAREKPYHIITIEDPVEYRYPTGLRSLIKQRQVGRDTHSFANGVRASLRQDPDVIVVGELLDNETAELALQAAQTGHLVFATIHAGTAAEVPGRIINMFPPDQRGVIAAQLAGVLKLFTFQQLLPRLKRGGVVPIFAVTPVTPAISNNIAEMEWQSLSGSCKEAAQSKGGITLLKSVEIMLDHQEITLGDANAILSLQEQDELRKKMAN